MRRMTAVLAGAVVFAGMSCASALAHDPRADRPNRSSVKSGTSVPLATSPNVRFVDAFPETLGISGEFARTGPFFYVSSLDSISVFDTSDPAHPKLRGTLADLEFENEAMSYGERTEGGVLRRFVLVGNDLYNATFDPQTGPQRGRIGGGEVIVVDVTDPDNPRVRSRTPGSSALPGAATTSTHTVQCVTTSCEFAYTAGDRGRFSVIDLRNLDRPVEVAAPLSPASSSNAIFTSGAGHYWDFDAAGIGWHTGSGGATAFDVSDPLNPRPRNGTDARGTQTPWNDFILHNSQRPNAGRFAAGAAPSVSTGNVLLVTEEDYANDGDEIVCDRAGTFQTWEIPSLDAAGYSAGTVGGGSIRPLDLINPVKAGDGLSAPVGGFCSAHWFDYHQSGIVAQGYYQQGLRFLDVRDARDLAQYGYVTGGASEVWDAYWVPQRSASGVAQDKKSNLVYSTDLVRGLEVYEVDVPSKDLGEEPSGPLPALP